MLLRAPPGVHGSDQYGMRRLKYIVNEEHINDIKSCDHQQQKQYVYLCINA